MHELNVTERKTTELRIEVKNQPSGSISGSSRVQRWRRVGILHDFDPYTGCADRFKILCLDLSPSPSNFAELQFRGRGSLFFGGCKLQHAAFEQVCWGVFGFRRAGRERDGHKATGARIDFGDGLP